MKKAVFLDRDGTLTDESVYPNFYSENCKLVEKNIWKVLKNLKEKWYLLVIITNQAWIDKWYYTEKDFWKFMKELEEQLDLKFDEIYFCQYHPDFSWESECRKPNNWMILQAQKDLNIDLKKSFMIGDSEKDIIAWDKSWCKTILYNGKGLDIDKFKIKPNFIVDSWREIEKLF